MISGSHYSLEIFFSYSNVDEELCNELEKHLSVLKRTNEITCWNNRKITAGTEWSSQINEHLNRAQLILLLISSDFLASDYCYSTEMKRAIERNNSGEAVVIPIILRPVFWEEAPFSQLSILPTNAIPVTKWENRDEAFANITVQVVQVIQSIRQLDKRNQVSDNQSLNPSEYSQEWAKRQSQEGNDLYLTTLDRAAEWARQRSDEGNGFWLEAVIAADQIAVPLRRTWKRLFGRG
jgi:TIR domain